jgi:hypothetical protein
MANVCFCVYIECFMVWALMYKLKEIGIGINKGQLELRDSFFHFLLRMRRSRSDCNGWIKENNSLICISKMLVEYLAGIQ